MSWRPCCSSVAARASPSARPASAFFGSPCPWWRPWTACPKPSPSSSTASSRDDLHIAAGPSAVAFILPPFLKRFRDEHPGIRLHVRSALVSDGLRLLSANEVDFVIGAKENGEERFLYHPVFSYDLVLITSLDHPLAGRESVDVREAAAWPGVVPPAGTYNRQFGESTAHRLGMEVKVAVEARGWGGDQAVRRGRSRDLRGSQPLHRRGRSVVGHPVRAIRAAAKLRGLHASRRAPVAARRSDSSG